MQGQLDERRRVFDARVYFKDFYGNADHITIRLSIEITEFDRIYLSTQTRFAIHPYSDQQACRGEIRCLKLEDDRQQVEMPLARRHVPDVYDLVYSTFVNRDIAVERSYVYDRTGGRNSAPAIKSFVNHKIRDLKVFEEQFELRYPIDLAKAEELGSKSYFSKPFGSGRRGARLATLRHGWRYTVECM